MDCFCCKYWREITPTFYEPEGGEECALHKPEFIDCEGCEAKLEIVE